MIKKLSSIVVVSIVLCTVITGFYVSASPVNADPLYPKTISNPIQGYYPYPYPLRFKRVWRRSDKYSCFSTYRHGKGVSGHCIYWGAIIDDKIHIRLFETEETLEEELRFFMTGNKALLGFVSLDAPLISNLNVKNNITLIPQYHRNMPLKQAEIIVSLVEKNYTEARLSRRGSSDLAIPKL